MTALAGCAVGVLVIAGCSAREPVEAPPASAVPGYGAAETPELMGAPPVESAPADGLLGGPAGPVRSVPVPTPVSVSKSSRLKTWRRPDGTLVTAMAPIANPKTTHRAVRYAPRAAAAPARHQIYAAAAKPSPVAHPVAKPAPKPAVVAAAPAPLKPVVAAKPVAPLAKAPTPIIAAVPVVKTAPAKPLSKLQKLQAAVAPEATRGAVLASGESLAKGQEGQVTLSLPATLGDMIKKEAQKLGLAKAAKKTSAYADLQGEGYEITPNGRQTAVVKPGEPATFAWQVKPTPEAKGALKTEFGVALNGTKPAQGFSLGSIAKQVVPLQEAVKEQTKGFKLALPDLGRFETVDVPGLGKVPGKSVLGGALVLLALLILVAIARGNSAAQARAERRRKFRTLTDYGRNEMEFEAPQTSTVAYVNPMVAAAGGALAGAGVATAVSHGHDDPAPTEHNPFAAPAHDYSHDDHHVSPPVGAEALPVGGHDHADAHAEDHGHDAPAPAADPGHHGDHGHAEHKELEPAH
ncbi:hypothetical protein [Caulobacter sp. Root655]|uniref:stalk-specific protein StpX n=1 Tax=Caulobacter sp. Root655 TaxID=1736578 RepID=UPI0026F455FD|nr:hypothetical protein [Caulobacter sp. Root655]